MRDGLTNPDHTRLVWRGDRYERVDDRPQPPEVPAAEVREAIDEAVAQLEAAAIERGAPPDVARERARYYRGCFRLHSSPAGAVIQGYTHGGWGTVRLDDAIRHIAGTIAQESQRAEEAPIPRPTAAELEERARREHRSSRDL